MRELGHEHFAVAGHDRGSYVAYRLALDHSEVVRKLAVLDCVPIAEALDRADARFAQARFHWFFFAQPEAGLTRANEWGQTPFAVPQRLVQALLPCSMGSDPVMNA